MLWRYIPNLLTLLKQGEKMSKSYKVFIIGNPKNQDSVNNVWQNNIVNKLTEYKDNRISFVCTQNYFDKPYSNETRLWELNQMQDSDLIIVDLFDIANNISAHCMLTAIQMMNKVRTKHTFVIGIGKSDTDNIWLTSCIFKQFLTLDEAAEYIADKIII